MRRSVEGGKGRCLPWSKEKEGAYIFWMKQVPVARHQYAVRRNSLKFGYIPPVICVNRNYYMTINILDSDWTIHYFTLHFKMWLSPLKSAHEVNITFEHCSVYSKIVFENVFSDWSIFKEAVLLSNQRFPINSLYYIFLFYVYRTLFSFSRHFVCFEFYSSSGGKFQVTGE